MSNNQHKMVSTSEPGYGRWNICTECGTTQHGGYWWLAGWKSKVPPPCTPHSFSTDDEWRSNAIEIDMDQEFKSNENNYDRKTQKPFSGKNC